MGDICFRARISIKGINPFVVVSRKCVESLAFQSRGPCPVEVRVNRAPAAGVKTNLMPRGDGSYLLYINATMRTAGQIDVGKIAEIRIAADPTYLPGPVHAMPELFTAALSNNSAAMTGWKKLIPSRKKEILRYFAGLKTPDALKRNVVKATEVLAGAKARFMARQWNDDSQQGHQR